MESSILRDNFIKLIERADVEKYHEIIIAVQQNNLDVLEEMVLERSTPGSSKYLQWMTFDQIGSVISNNDGYDAVVSWLSNIADAKISWHSPRKEYIKVSAPLKVWETELNTIFYTYQDLSQLEKEPSIYIVAHEYSIPIGLKSHISSIFNTVQVPPRFNKKYLKGQSSINNSFRDDVIFESPSKSKLETSLDSSSAVTVSKLNSFYHIPSNLGSSKIQQSVFETSMESFSPKDLSLFQSMYGLTAQEAQAPYGYNTSSCYPSTAPSSADCYEGNLDIQYIMGVAQNVASIYWYVGGSNPFVTWITQVASETNPPSVNSISWGTYENEVSASTLNSFNTEAMKLAAMGVTVLASSGDSGVSNFGCSCSQSSSSSILPWSTASSWTGKGYFPSFPATSPYVTAVGGTMGLNTGSSEIACQSQLGGVITTGGGFSMYFPTPSWQSKSVTNYLSAVAPTPGYNPQGRAYPDISLMAVEFPVVVNSQLTTLFGTSASAPVMAAMVSLVNSARYSRGLGPVGFINPTLYSLGESATITDIFNDIASGSNNCCANGNYPTANTTCCSAGFNSSVGWDPVTGWGSIYYPSFAEAFK